MANVDNITAYLLQPRKLYKYEYRGKVRVGAGEDLPESSLKFSSQVVIQSESEDIYYIQVRVVANAGEEKCNGVCSLSRLL